VNGRDRIRRGRQAIAKLPAAPESRHLAGKHLQDGVVVPLFGAVRANFVPGTQSAKLMERLLGAADREPKGIGGNGSAHDRSDLIIMSFEVVDQRVLEQELFFVSGKVGEVLAGNERPLRAVCPEEVRGQAIPEQSSQ
jgi:hypothetical protein